MVDNQTVCCMCGDVGFPDKIFHCNRCRHRFQHSYCSSYYSESSEKMELCDWCQSEERRVKHGGGVGGGGGGGGGLSSSSRRSAGGHEHGMSMNRSEYSGGERIKQNNDVKEDNTADKGGKSTTSPAPSPRPTGRRYKLLKDVMC